MPRQLPPTLRQVEDMFYRSSPTCMEVFTLKPEIASADDDPRELVLPPLPPDFDAPSPSRRQVAPAMEPPLAHWVVRSAGRGHRHAVRAGDGFPGGGVALGPVVARAFCCGQLLVGKVNAQDRTCCVAYEGRVFEAMRYEVLAVERGRVEWVACRNGYVPPSAMPGGMTLQSNKIYPVRVYINGSLIPGQIIKGERSCRIPYEKHELMFREYEVLTLRCSQDKRPGPSKRLGPTDEEWEEFVVPKSSHQLDIPRLLKGDHTVPPTTRVCLAASDLPKGGGSSDSRNSFNKPNLSAGENVPGPVVAAGERVPGPSHQMESLVTKTTDCDDSPRPLQDLARPCPRQGPGPRL